MQRLRARAPAGQRTAAGGSQHDPMDLWRKRPRAVQPPPPKGPTGRGLPPKGPPA